MNIKCRFDRFVAVVLVSVLVGLPGCATFQVVGGPNNINKTYSPSEFVKDMSVQVSDSSDARKALNVLKKKRNTVISLAVSSIALSVVSSLLAGIGSRIQYNEEHGSSAYDSTHFYAGAAATGIAALLFAGTQLFVGPTGKDYQDVLVGFNKDYPEKRFVSYDLGVF